MPEFTHLHVHTQFSLLDGAAQINSLVKEAKKNEMRALAITDHGNMFGVPKFVSEAKKQGITPIIGCEFYITNDRFNRKDQVRYHQLILAKNQTGYKNLSRLCSAGFIEGMYYKPRIDKKIIREFKEGLIATTCCLASEVNRTIILKGEKEAEKLFLEWLEIFGEDYYIELQRHGIKEQDTCNEILLSWSKKYNVKVIATNDVHYINVKDSEAQDILLCLQTGKDFDDPNRMRFENNQFYLKTKQEMQELFKDVPESLDNTNEILGKVELPKLERDILLPIYTLPEGFLSEDEYLKYISFEGAKKKYGEITNDITSRLNFELNVIKNMGFAGYFLIVQDFIDAAKKLNVSVGPGRGSAAGSAVAYCTGITNIDPIRYNLLFERFLNPERISMPDIDIDFDDEGRQKVIDYVVDKYGKNRVAQIITFGTMAAKSSIRDVARVLGLPLPEADRLAKLVPDGLGVTLKKSFEAVKELADAKSSSNVLIAKTLSFAEVLEGSARHTGIHAAGIIIAPDDLQEHIPLCTSKESDLLVTQYDGKYVESVGMLKMDFLGLKTLTIINDCIKNIEENHGIKLDIDKIPLDDEKAFQLYQKGDTIGTFQFESDGMRAYLKELKPNNIEDLIAMNALYRPGPMDFIPKFINCKHGKQAVEYPHEMLEDILKNTYGIMVYQEQIMQAAQVMGGFTLGAADLLRRAMGKKQVDVMEKQKTVFVEGATKKGIDAKKAEEVFNVMAKFAEYGFNRSHSAAYSILAYQTGYLKANYPAEYMAAVLTHNMNDIKKITFFMDECRHMNISVKGPDINESNLKFVVNKKGEIRFGLGAVKGMGENAVKAIVEERNINGHFKSVFDIVMRVNSRAVNKRCLESLALAGAFDCFTEIHRAQYFYAEAADSIGTLEKIIKYGNNYQESKNTAQHSLFGGVSTVEIPEPILTACEPWSKLEQLHKEKDVIGIYISGHPLDDYKLEINNFCSCSIDQLSELANYKNKEVSIAGIVTEVNHKTSKKGKPFGSFIIEDYTNSIQLALFSEDYLRLKHFLVKDALLFVKGKVQTRFNSPQLEFRISLIQLLVEIKDKLAQHLTLKVALSDISEELVKRLSQIVTMNSGKCSLRFAVIDRAERISLEMPSKKFKVSLNGEFIKMLEEIPEIEYKIN